MSMTDHQIEIEEVLNGLRSRLDDMLRLEFRGTRIVGGAGCLPVRELTQVLPFRGRGMHGVIQHSPGTNERRTVLTGFLVFVGSGLTRRLE